MNAAAIHDARNASYVRRRAVRSLAIGVAAAVVMAYLGMLGTGSTSFVNRLVYWATVILPGSVIGLAVYEMVRGWGGLAGRRVIEITLIALLVSVPHSFMVIVASALFFGLSAITPELVLNFWLAVLVVSLVLTAINHLAAGEQAEVAQAPLAPRPATDPALLAAPAVVALAGEDGLAALLAPPGPIAEKLPSRLRGARLIAMSAEDHYLRIHTEAGSDLVLMRLSDACALLPEKAGARVHRGWWVAKCAVEGRTRLAGKVTLTLTGGLIVPVSRTMQATLREQS